MRMAAPVGCFDTSDSKTNLIINYLPQGYTDEEFQALFQTVGPLKSCKICRNKATGYSYGFGFVEYYTPEHAQLAIDTLNGYQIHNKFLKVALSRKGGEKIKGANLYVRNFPKSWTSEDLKSLFVPYGNIINGKVLTDPVTGFSRGVGFILYNLKSEAEAAINALNNTMPLGTTEIMYVRFADDNTNKLRPPVQSTPQFQRPSFQITPSQRAIGPMAQAVMNRRANRFNPLTTGVQIPPPNPVFNQAAATTEGCTLFVYNIGVAATEAEVFQLFAPYGEVKKVNIMWDWEKGQCKGFCFVTMATIQQAQAAIVALNGYQYATRPLQVKLKTAKV